MDKEINEFYAADGLHIEKMIARRPDNLHPSQVEAAAEELYNQIQNGRELPPIRRVWEVWRIAKNICAREYDDRADTVAGQQQQLAALRRKIIWVSVLAGASAPVAAILGGYFL